MREILTKIQDIFPDKFIVGGSYARNNMLRTAKEPVRINCHTSVSTPEQLKKNIDFCLEHNKEFFLEHVPLKVPQSESLTEEDFYKVFLRSGHLRGGIL
jgi:hypothetical protein